MYSTTDQDSLFVSRETNNSIADAPVTSKKSNCGIVALAATTGYTVEDITAWFRKTYRKTNRWQGRTHLGQLLHFIRKHKGLAAKRVAPGGSLKTWVENETALSTQRGYIARVGGHFVAVIGGEVIDQYETKPAADHWASSTRVTDAIEVELW